MKLTPSAIALPLRKSNEPLVAIVFTFGSKMADFQVTTDQHVLANAQNEIENYNDVVDGARAAADNEKSMTLREGLKRYPAAVGWSVLFSTAM